MNDSSENRGYTSIKIHLVDTIDGGLEVREWGSGNPVVMIPSLGRTAKALIYSPVNVPNSGRALLPEQPEIVH